jgi:hypothetical protein
MGATIFAATFMCLYRRKPSALSVASRTRMTGTTGEAELAGGLRDPLTGNLTLPRWHPTE